MIQSQCKLKFIDGYFKKEGYIIQLKEWVVSDLLQLILPGSFFCDSCIFNMLLKKLKISQKYLKR